MRGEKDEKSSPTKKEPSQTNIKLCYKCGGMIFGEYEYIKTQRGTEIYMHKDCANGRAGGEK